MLDICRLDEQEGIATAEADVAAPAEKNNAFSVMMRASSSVVASAGALMRSIELLIDTQVLTERILGLVVANAFDVLMKSSKTQAVTASVAVFPAGRLSVPAPQNNNGKKRRSNWSSSGPSSSRRYSPCPEFKCIKGTQPRFVVDGFQYAAKTLSSVYFLTHFHSDHYIGLQKVEFDSHLMTNQVPILQCGFAGV